MRSIACGTAAVWGRWLLSALTLMFASLLLPQAAHAANCSIATSQGATGPADYQTYCWIDFSSYNDAVARSVAGQNFSLLLQDGTTMSFTLRVSGAAVNDAASPSWTGAAVGNTAFLGITGQPILYQTAAGTTTITISNIVLTPPAGSQAITSYMLVAADAESSNETESLSFNTNGGNWIQLDQVGPISGATYPTISGIGTSTFTETGVAGTVGAYIVGSSTPTTVTTTLVGGGLQGAMFAVRFASIRLTTQITGARINAADQFNFTISATSNGTILSSGTSTGTGLGPFNAAALSSASALPLTLTQAMAGGSASALAQYRTRLSCINGSSGSSTPMPTNLTATNYSFGALQFGDSVQCTFTETPFPHLQLQKTLGTGGRRFNTDQFTLNIVQGTTTVATTTTAGTGSTITNGATPQYQATAGTGYAMNEVGAGATALNQYTATMTCTNANGTSSTTLPTTVGGLVTPQIGDVITCTIRNTRKASNALLAISKSAIPLQDPVNGAVNPKLIPGAVIRYTFSVSNSGPSAVDNNSVWLIDLLPSSVLVGSASTPVFAQGSPSSGLTFNAATDIRYSNSASPPANFAACNYTPVSAYDPAVRFVCINPKGSMAGSTGTPPSFNLSIQARMN